MFNNGTIVLKLSLRGKAEIQSEVKWGWEVGEKGAREGKQPENESTTQNSWFWGEVWNLAQ